MNASPLTILLGSAAVRNTSRYALASIAAESAEMPRVRPHPGAADAMTSASLVCIPRGNCEERVGDKPAIRHQRRGITGKTPPRRANPDRRWDQQRAAPPRRVRHATAIEAAIAIRLDAEVLAWLREVATLRHSGQAQPARGGAQRCVRRRNPGA
jgi:hypothetical protein